MRVLYEFLEGPDSTTFKKGVLLRWANYGAVVDVWVLGVLSWLLLVVFTLLWGEMLEGMGLDWLKSNWDLRQVLAVSTIVPVTSTYLQRLRKSLRFNFASVKRNPR